MAAWTKEDARRPLQASIRVLNLKEHLDYYQKHFGMQILQQGADGKSASVGFGPDKFALQMVEDAGPLDLGTGFGHFGIAIPDVYQAVDKIKADGGKVTREAGPVKGGQTVIAFVMDPSGYMWELLQRQASPEPLCQVMLRVGDLPRSIECYRDVLGMQLVKERDNPEYKYTLGFMGYGPEESSLVMELTYNYGKTQYEKGNGYLHTAFTTTDVHRSAEQIKESGGTLLQEPAQLPGSDSWGCMTEDPDGWKVMLVEKKA